MVRQVISRSLEREQFQCDNDRKPTVCWSDCSVTGATVKVSLNEGYSKILPLLRLPQFTCWIGYNVIIFCQLIN